MSAHAETATARPLPLNAAGLPVSKPEVLAPAGGWDCARAAVENGADAIFFGVGRFNARVRANNFTEADLPELMAFLHSRGVKGYVTFNTLIFGDELAEAERSLREIIASGVDAAIVQDVGICRLIRRLSPDFPIHASTQMTVTGAAGAEFVRELGAELAVLSREVNVTEMRSMQEELRQAGHSLRLETFVHGALCVAYSGQCLTSEALGGRSANRGECAQACRLPYELISDGAKVDLGDRKYLLSPRDLAGMEVIPELILAGISSLKIEGRLKTPEYVAAMSRAYRDAVDRCFAAIAAGETDPAKLAEIARGVRGRWEYDLEMAFSRGLFTGWLQGIDNRRLVHARFGKKRGVFLGEVMRTRPNGVELRLAGPLKPGDGVVFDDGKPEAGEQGGFVHGVESGPAGLSFVRFAREAIDFRRVTPGQKLWKTSDPALTAELRATFAGDKPRFRRPVEWRVWAAPGSPLRAELRDAEGHVVAGESSVPCEAAQQRPMTRDTLADQFGRLGGTPFDLGSLEADIEGAPMLPVSELNRLRRDMVARLESLRAAPKRWTLVQEKDSESAPLWQIDGPRFASSAARTATPEIIPVVRNSSQLDAALRWGADTVYCEFEDPKKYRDAVKSVRAHSEVSGSKVEVWVMPPRLFKQGEEWMVKQVLSCEADGYLARCHEHLREFQKLGVRRRGDFSLNISNPVAAEYLKNRYGLERLTAGYDLNAAQLDALLAGAPADWFEVTLHQHMPMFHMEHCVFCSFLSNGKDYRDCGRPCEKHSVRLRDRVGMDHILLADAGCRNTVYNARAQTGAEVAEALLARGVRHFRVEFVDESPDTLLTTLNRYKALLAGEITGAQLWRELKLENKLGVTRGTTVEKLRPPGTKGF